MLPHCQLHQARRLHSTHHTAAAAPTAFGIGIASSYSRYFMAAVSHSDSKVSSTTCKGVYRLAQLAVPWGVLRWQGTRGVHTHHSLLASKGLAPHATMMKTGNSRLASAAPTWKGRKMVAATHGKPKPGEGRAEEGRGMRGTTREAFCLPAFLTCCLSN